MYLNEIDKNFTLENTQYECKSRLDRDNILDWLKTVGGFANAEGGILYIGVEDKTSKLIGFTKADLDKEKLFFYQQIKQHMANIPSIVSSVVSYFINGGERYILKLTIQESKIKPIIVKYQEMPMIFMRRDGYTNSATIEEIQKMSREYKSPSYDTQITDIKYNRDDFKSFFQFFAERHEGKVPTDKELGSIGFFDDEMYLSQGAYLFSDKYEGEDTKVVCSLYKGITRGDDFVLASNPFSGNLIKTYEFIWDFVQTRMNHGFIKTEDSRINLDAFPARALFEAIINSLAHRDYFLSNSQISIDLFINRISISSPGSLFNGGDIPVTYNLDSFISRRRNKVISDIFVFAKAMEAKGTGFEKISFAYQDVNPLHKPFIFSKNNQFTIVLPDLTYKDGVKIEDDRLTLTGSISNSSRFDYQILAYCYANYRTAKEIAEYVHASDSTFFREKIDNLVKQEYLLPSKEGKAVSYLSNVDKVKLR